MPIGPPVVRDCKQRRVLCRSDRMERADLAPPKVWHWVPRASRSSMRPPPGIARSTALVTHSRETTASRNSRGGTRTRDPGIISPVLLGGREKKARVSRHRAA